MRAVSTQYVWGKGWGGVSLDALWNVLGWVAAGLNVWGNLALTTKGRAGWIIRIACNLCWMPYGVYTRAWALCANHLLFVAINCYGWWRWKRDEERDRSVGDIPPAPSYERMRRQAYEDGFAAGRRAT